MERYANVKDAFQAEEKIVSGRSVLIIDDVTTSGATMDACASALLQAGAREVYGLTLARSVSQGGRYPESWKAII